MSTKAAPSGRSGWTASVGRAEQERQPALERAHIGRPGADADGGGSRGVGREGRRVGREREGDLVERPEAVAARLLLDIALALRCSSSSRSSAATSVVQAAIVGGHVARPGGRGRGRTDLAREDDDDPGGEHARSGRPRRGGG